METPAARLLALARLFAAVLGLMGGAEAYARGFGPLAAAVVCLVGFAAVYGLGLLVVRRALPAAPRHLDDGPNRDPDSGRDPNCDEVPVPSVRPRPAERASRRGRVLRGPS